MPEYDKINGFSIRLRFNDHLPMHFHAVKGESEIVVDVEHLKVIKNHGKINPGDIRKLIKYAEEKQNEIITFWREIH